MNDSDQNSMKVLLEAGLLSAGTRTMADATIMTLGIAALVPMLENMTSQMGASAESRRQAVMQSNQTAAVELANLARTLTLVLNDGTTRSETRREFVEDSRSELAVT